MELTVLIPQQSTLGLPSSRPELRCHTESAIQQFQDNFLNIQWKRNLEMNLNNCSKLISLEEKCVTALVDCGYTSSETPFLFRLEKSLLDLSSPHLTDGSFYCSLFKVGNSMYCRYFESGVLSGFFLTEGIRMVKNEISSLLDDFTASGLIWCNVATSDDIQQYHEKYTKRLERKRSRMTAETSQTAVGKRYTNLLQKNSSSVLNSHKGLMAMAQNQSPEDNCQLIATVVHVIKKNSYKEKDQQKARFMETSGSFQPVVFRWESALQNFRTHGKEVEPISFDSLFNKPNSFHLSDHEQCLLISSIPNNHYYNQGDQSHVGYARMLSVRDITGKYRPASLRNLVLCNYREGKLGQIYSLVNKYYNPMDSSSFENPVNEIQHCSPRHITTGSRRKVLSEEDVLRNLQYINPKFTTRNRASDNTLYDTYKMAQVEGQGLLWRVHAPSIDVLVMNDINMDTGTFLDNSFVHITRITGGDQVQYNCTCQLYTTLLQLATLNEDDADVEAVNLRCCHIRFFQDFIEADLTLYFASSDFLAKSKVQKLVKASQNYIGKAICKLSKIGDRTNKFSVLSPDNLSCNFVHVTNGKVGCQSGTCRAAFSCSQRNVKYLNDNNNICDHLKAMRDNIELWWEAPNLLSEELEDHDIESESETFNERDDVTLENTNQGTQTTNFDPITGLWDFPSLSTHIPMEQNDKRLQFHINERQKIHDGANDIGRDREGYLMRENQLSLFPPLPQEVCSCGAGYADASNIQGLLSDVRFKPVIYLMNGPAKYFVYDRECLARNPECRIKYSGNCHALHFLSSETAAGDELGWDFVNHVLNTHITFRGFCKIMTQRYSMCYTNTANFMSAQTFIAWWFSWSSKFKIDFRQPCHICKFQPKYLACDGTKIGINFRHANVNPIETPSLEQQIDPCHRRNNRSFLHYKNNDMDQNELVRKSRDHLLYLSKKILGLLNDKELIPQNTETCFTTELLTLVDEPCREILYKFANNIYPSVLNKSLAVLFKVLSSNHSLSSVLPFRFIDFFESILSDIDPFRSIIRMTNKINVLKEFSPEICDILLNTLSYRAAFPDILCFFNYLVVRLREIKELNKKPDEALPQVGSYNPEKFGLAYYFTSTGEKLRDVPIYTMNSDAHSKNYDDLPTRTSEHCNKIYPEVSRKGTTYLFLWFDPKHYGHCYGFHMIPGSEGRKDPFTSAYCYMKEAPQELFYDFACQLEEYCLNREPGFWERTRFFHDLFHGFSHKCPCVYKSQRLLQLQDLNTEICEQFNSFIQRIKFSARSMTLGKFCYFLQFMIHQWCMKKKAAFEKRCNIAAAFLT